MEIKKIVLYQKWKIPSEDTEMELEDQARMCKLVGKGKDALVVVEPPVTTTGLVLLSVEEHLQVPSTRRLRSQLEPVLLSAHLK